ncbi:MAG: YciI family protein [Nitrospirota bacterium]
MNTQNHNGYILLYRSDEWYNKLSHEELRKLMDQNKAWIERLTAQGKVKPGRALERRGVIVSGTNGRFVTDGPFAESKEAIAGYLVLDVQTMDEAIAIVQSSPGLAYGGSIEVRPLAEECPLDVRERELAREEQLATV